MWKLLIFLLPIISGADTSHPKYYDGLLRRFYTQISSQFYKADKQNNRNLIAYQPFLSQSFLGGTLLNHGYVMDEGSVRYPSRIFKLSETSILRMYPLDHVEIDALNVLIPTYQGDVITSLPQHYKEGTKLAPLPKLFLQCIDEKKTYQPMTIDQPFEFFGSLVDRDLGIYAEMENKSLEFKSAKKVETIRQVYWPLNIATGKVCLAEITYFRIMEEKDDACKTFETLDGMKICSMREVLKFKVK